MSVATDDSKEISNKIMTSHSEDSTVTNKKPAENDAVASHADLPCSPSMSQPHVPSQTNNENAATMIVDDAADVIADCCNKSNDDSSTGVSSDSHCENASVDAGSSLGCVRDLINSAIEKNLLASETLKSMAPSGLMHVLCVLLINVPNLFADYCEIELDTHPDICSVILFCPLLKYKTGHHR